MTPELIDRYIRPHKGRAVLLKSEYRTNDIIDAVLDADKSGVCADVAELAKHIKYTDLNDLCFQLFDILKNHIRYCEDPIGMQGIRTPAALWGTRTGDCKSYSLFVGSILKCLQIPYKYRFVAYNDAKRIQHVYPIAIGKNKEIIIDAVFGKYNQQKLPITDIKDFKMNGLYRIEGIGTQVTKTQMQKPIDQMSDADMELFILRQRMEIERDHVAGIGAIWKANEYNAVIGVIDDFISAIGSDDIGRMDNIIKKVKGQKAKAALENIKQKHISKRPALNVYINYDEIGKISFKKNVKGAGKIVKKAGKAAGKAGKAVVKTAAKAGKAVVKVVTLPARLAAKGLIEVSLPKAAPAFLYLFVNDKKLIEQLPAKVRAKRKKQEKFCDFIVNAIGMKRSHLMGILRNGIMKKYGMSPEKKLAQLMKKPQVSGIGIAPALLPAIPTIVSTISKIFGKKSPGFGAEDQPSEDDFAGESTQANTALANQVIKQSDAIEPGESLTAAAATDTATDTATATSSDGSATSSGDVIPESGGRKVRGICG